MSDIVYTIITTDDETDIYLCDAVYKRLHSFISVSFSRLTNYWKFSLTSTARTINI
jgi:hypothetical protein